MRDNRIERTCLVVCLTICLPAAASQASAQDGSIVSGRVQESETARPVVAAIVKFYRPTNQDPRRIKFTGEATTDEQGRYRVRLRRTVEGPLFAAVTEADGYRTADPSNVYLRPDEIRKHSPPVTETDGEFRFAPIRLSKTLVLPVIARLPAAHQIQSVEVSLNGRVDPGPPRPKDWLANPVTSTDFEDATDTLSVSLELKHDRWQRAEIQIKAVGDQATWYGRLVIEHEHVTSRRKADPGQLDPIELALRPAQWLRGIVASGEPISGASIRVKQVNPNQLRDGEQEVLTEFATATTGDDGRYEFLLEADFDYALEVSKPGYYSGSQRAVWLADSGWQLSASVGLDNLLMLEIIPARDGVIHGMVVDHDGRPLSGVKVWYQGQSNRRITSGGTDTSDEHGRFRIERLVDSSGTLYLYPATDDLRTDRQAAGRSMVSRVPVSVGDSFQFIRLDRRLALPEAKRSAVAIEQIPQNESEASADSSPEAPKPRAGNVSGIVLTKAGKPVTDARLYFTWKRNTMWMPDHRPVFTGDGSFAVPVPADFERVKIAVHSDDHAGVMIEGDVDEFSAKEIRLSANCVMHGRVVFEDEGVPDFPLMLSAHTSLRMAGPRQYNANTDREGRFRFTGLRPETTYTLTHKVAEDLPVSMPLLEVRSPKVGFDADLGEIEAVPGVTLSIDLSELDRLDDPPESGWVSITTYRNDAQVFRQSLDNLGEPLVVRGLPIGSMRLRLHLPHSDGLKYQVSPWLQPLSAGEFAFRTDRDLNVRVRVRQPTK